MIDRQYGKIKIECDSCDDVFEGDSVAGNGFDEFTEVWNAAKREGWTTRKIAGEWMHGCGKCGVPS